MDLHYHLSCLLFSFSSSANSIFLCYELIYRSTYLESKNIARLLEAAGKTLVVLYESCDLHVMV